MRKCRVRAATYDDVPAIMRFINQYWKKDHILATNRTLFEWQYISDSKVNFVIGVDDMDNLQGILGFIPYDSTNEKDLSLALWKANQEQQFLGIRLMSYLAKEIPHKNIVCTGINMETTSKIYTRMGMKIGTMTQWYRLTPRNEYKVAVVVNKEIPCVQPSIYSLQRVKDFVQIEAAFDFFKYKDNTIPYKSKEYIKKRYFEHPIYQYQTYEVREKDADISALIVLRIQDYSGSKVFRFVDCIGDINVLKTVTSELDRLMIENQVEYIDMYETGIQQNMLLEAGWISVKESGNMIPNYFSPYLQRTVDIHYCKSDEKAILFRGDGDQDRPS